MRLTILLIGILFHSCSNDLSKRTEYCMQFSGGNRAELEKVLLYYKNEPQKLQAARFLLANMPYYFAYTDTKIDSIKNILKGAVKAKGFIEDSVKIKWQHADWGPNLKRFDAHVITADLLIENINFAFDVWESRTWSKYYSFDDFCEYILPYRIEDEPLEKWRKVYYEKYSSILDSLYQGSDVVEAAKAIVSYLKKEKFTNNHDFSIPHLGASYLMNNRVGYCRENCDVAIYVLRSLGIPVATDSYHISPVYQSRHYWSALVDTNKRTIPFNYVEEEIRRGYYGNRKKGKVYRCCFGVQPEKFSGIYQDRSVYPLFTTPFIKDVTSEYTRKDLSAKIPVKQNINERYVYLAIWTGRNYEPIDIAEINKGQVYFKGLEEHVIYHPVYRSHEGLSPVDYPFYLKNGEVYFFVPDTSQIKIRKIYRKYPMRSHIREYMNDVQGLKLEADNRSDFKNAKLLYQVADTPTTNYNRVVLNEPSRSRYYRIMPEAEHRIQLAEIWFYKDTLMKERVSPCNVTLNRGTDRQKATIKRLIDDDWVSFYRSNRWKEILTFDFRKPVEVKCFVYIPRNDDNFVRAGETYELFYQNGSFGWKSLGKQLAEKNVLVYSDVPDNTLLWLKNHTKGKEERAFYYENSQQIFP